MYLHVDISQKLHIFLLELHYEIELLVNTVVHLYNIQTPVTKFIKIARIYIQ
jgi:hypothetical protein